MRNYIIKRLGIGAVLLLSYHSWFLALLYFMPGDPVTLMANVK